MADGPSNKSDSPRKNVRGKREKKGKKRFSGRKALVWLFFATAVAVICGIIGYLLVVLNGERILDENKDKFELPESSIIYDADGNEVTKLYRQNREVIKYEDIPKLLREAVIATEDRRFEEHSGIDFWSISRALVKDVVARSAVEGGSTITQQLAKNLFLSGDKTFFRKATEASIAVALENQMTKDEILTLYLNRIFFGKNAYGVKSAAKVYFNKSLDELELWEIATLAGIPKAPSTYNPISNPDKSKERRAVVLQLMYDQKYITKEQMDEAKAREYDPSVRSADSQQFPAFIDYVIEEAERVTGITEEELRSGGYKLYTTLNVKAQTVMEKEFKDDSNFEESVDEQQVEGAMVIIDHRTGNIQGLVGGRDYERKGWNRAVKERQPGSGFKPITVYGPALETGDWYPWTNVLDEKRCYGNYCPTDSNANKYIGEISMRQSIKESRNASAVWLLNEIGVKTGLNFAEKLGFDLDSKNDRNLAIALGGLTKGVTPMQMATAYSVFANGGKAVDAHSLLRVINSNGETEYQYEAPKTKQLIKAETAWYLTEIMQSVLEKGGTGTRARIDRPVAGKTGTTQHGIPNFRSSGNRDAWFSGYTPEWTAVVWMGYDKTDKKHLLKKSSSQSASMFAKVMKEAMKDVPKSSFKKPNNVEEKKPLSVVTNFNAVYNPETITLKLTWTPVEGKDMTYRIYRKETSEAEFTRLLDAVAASEVDDLSISPGLTYQYYITAYNAKDNLESEPSEHIQVEIPALELEPETPVEPGPDNGGTLPPDDGSEPGPGNGGTDNGGIDNGGELPPDGGTPGNNGAGPGNGTGNGNGNSGIGTEGTGNGSTNTGGVITEEPGGNITPEGETAPIINNETESGG
ncbi:PBP1A family penicillin-binding protein [Paenibacillus oenotherae]|uniref:PBP1A family penicillin-binding protein n=1 Tax=Paenibacillus oenotherae TaxID=1435645 RepID=A0ABS7DD51_9BACL|nr:penicillin-binding protein 1A [Paenibacillus oenotherae]MBW7477820.1 PBP1A family penicillin-binding protein [Paenibacillus oenotherae]